MASKRKREEEDEFGSDDDSRGQARGRTGRMRKKSAKVIEMEEAEELEKQERKQWKKDQNKATKKSKTIKSTLLRSPGAGSAAAKQSVKTEPLVMDLEVNEDEAESPQEPLKMTLHIPSGEKSTKKKGKKSPASAAPPILDEEDIKPDVDGPLMMKFVMTPGKELKVEETTSVKPESGKKKKSDADGGKKGKKGKSTTVAAVPTSPTLSPELLAHLSAAADPPPPALLDLPKKEKKVKAVAMPAIKSEEAEINSDDDDDDMDDDMDDDDDDEEEDDEPVAYANTTQMAHKVLTSSEKKAGKGKKKEKKEDPEKPKKKRGPTAYMLWCSSRRPKLVEDNPGIDFATISKRLGEIWHSIPEKEKMSWKRKAKKLATKGSSMINTGKAKASSTLLNKGSNQPQLGSLILGSGGGARQAAMMAGRVGVAGSSRQQPVDEISVMSARSNAAVTPLDAAAHLKLLGESLSIIGARLQEHQGKIAVQGSFSVLLDSLLCALGPLVALTNQVPELDGVPAHVHNSTLDNIAFVMPGIG